MKRARPRAGGADLRAGLGLLLVLVLAGCERGEAPPPAVSTTVWDSGGVRYVENLGDRWSDADRWRVLPEPFLRIGGIEDRHAQLARISAVATLPGGAIVISQGDELTFLADTGELRASVRSPGAGPGGFSWIGALWRVCHEAEGQPPSASSSSALRR